MSPRAPLFVLVPVLHVLPLSSGCGSDGPCAPLATTTIGPEGGTLRHCDGARLVVPPGAVASPTEFSLERIELTAAPEVPYVLAGPAFVLGPASLAPALGVSLWLPHDGGARMELARYVAPEFERIEVCDVTDARVGQAVYAPGTYVALHDPTVYPESTAGLGSGSVSFTLDGVADVLDVDPSGLAIDEAHGRDRQLTLVYRRSADAGLVQLELKLQIPDGGPATLAQVSHADTSTGAIWSADVLGFPNDLQVTITGDDGAHLEGTVDATLHLGDATRTLHATFSATPALFRFPPERVCEAPEG